MNFHHILKISFILGILWLFVLANSPVQTKQIKNTTTYAVDTTRSIIHWDCHHKGTIKIKNGIIEFHNDEPVSASINVNMQSIKNHDIQNDLLQGTLENVLKSIEFFNIGEYPFSRFESHQIIKIDSTKYLFKGDFVLFERGICTSFKGTIDLKKDSLYFNTENVIIDRTDWGIFYVSRNNPFPKEEEAGFTVSDTINLNAKIVAYLQK
jgi:polyisoprenoid-binding protein YceI